MPERTREYGQLVERTDPEHGGRGPLGRIGLAEVYNPSMEPTLLPGDQLVVRYGAPVRTGDIVVLRHPFQHDLLIVKRAVERCHGGWWVRGDNPLVVNDSREFGAVPDELVIARAWLRVRPPRGVHSMGSAVRWSSGAVRPLVGPLRPRSGGAARSSSRLLSRRLRAR